MEKKRRHAMNILERELKKLFVVTKIQTLGPYELQTTCEILHQTYKCQFFIFNNSTTKHKLHYMFPDKYNDELIPIFLYQSFSNLNHIIFIKNINSYFKANYLVCFECKKSFKTHTYRHLCSKRPTCFVCRRFFQTTSTYVHEKLLNFFCDKLLTTEESFTCKLCNCIIYSNHCLKGHKKFCNGKEGRFGYYCSLCKRFIYASNNETSLTMRQNHSCSDEMLCKLCLKMKEPNHLCKMKETKISAHHNRLGFLNLEIEVDKNCSPLFALIYLETKKRGYFEKHLVADPSLELYCSDDSFQFSYFLAGSANTAFKSNSKRKSKITQDFTWALKAMQNPNCYDFNRNLVLFLLSSPFTTFICQDKEGLVMVRLPQI